MSVVGQHAPSSHILAASSKVLSDVRCVPFGNIVYSDFKMKPNRLVLSSLPCSEVAAESWAGRFSACRGRPHPCRRFTSPLTA